MDSRLVLVIEGDEPTANQLAAAIREADYEVVVSGGARAGLDIAIEIKPDCIVCDVDLPDEDGYWVARNIRTHASHVAVTPFLFLSPYDDAESRLEGFHVGADVYMTIPFATEEVVAQVDALVKLAARLRQRRDSILSAAPEQSYGSTAIEGDMRQMSVATVLSVLGMERRTGVFEVVSKKRRAQIEIAAGYVVHGTIGGTRVAALSAMRLMLTWKVGRFSFMSLPPCDPPESLRTVQALLLDAAKAEDEDAATNAKSLGAMSVSSFGGPPSRPDDMGPPSSRAMRGGETPLSLRFDLIPSRRPEDLPAAEVAKAVDPAVAAFERNRPSSTMPPTSAGSRKTVAKGGAKPALKPAEQRRPAPTQAAFGMDRAPLSAPLSVELQEVEIDEESISVRLDEVEFDEAIGAEQMLHEEQQKKVVSVSWNNVARNVGASHPSAGPRAAPTPPSGTPLGGLRRTPAIAPPPNATANVGRMPAPPPAPRPLGASKAVPEKGRSLPRPNPKKN